MATEIRQVGDQYAVVPASSTALVLGGGHLGGRVTGVLIIPATTSPGAVSLIDTSGAGTTITVFPGGASSVASLAPIFIPITISTANSTGKWECTTGANVSAVVQGLFS